AEEARFAETLDQGMEILESAIAQLDGTVLPGGLVFRLYDTYGFPVDLTADIARERGLTVDQQGFEAQMAVQRDRARAASKFGTGGEVWIDTTAEKTYTRDERVDRISTVVALYRNGAEVAGLKEGEEGAVVLEETPFYVECGGQVGDTGALERDGGSFTVTDT